MSSKNSCESELFILQNFLEDMATEKSRVFLTKKDGLLAKMLFTEFGVKKAFRFLRSSLKEVVCGSVTAIASDSALFLKTTCGLMILFPIEQEMAGLSRF